MRPRFGLPAVVDLLAGGMLLGVCLLVATPGAIAGPLPAASDKPEPAQGVLAPPAPETVRTRIFEWVASQNVRDAQLLDRIGRLWVSRTPAPHPEELLEQTVQTFSVVDSAAAKLVAACTPGGSFAMVPDPSVLAGERSTPFFRANLGLYFGRSLAQRQLYDEALEVLMGIPAVDVVDPASLLFFKAVCQHGLLQKKEGLQTIEQLLKNTEKVPSRYATVATLMQYDLEALREKTLDEVSRKMSDVERRLYLGRTGQKVQKKEEEIVATLDDLIKKLEAQQGGGGGSSSGKSGKSNRSSNPAQDSSVKGETAPGEVDRKNFKPEGGWGALPPKARAKAREDIARKFPANYRQAIEEFTRKQAARSAPGSK